MKVSNWLIQLENESIEAIKEPVLLDLYIKVLTFYRFIVAFRLDKLVRI